MNRPRWRKVLTTGVMSETEYRANHAGLNTFFGAVLGFVLAGTETLDSLDFGFVLLMLSGVVISILYISASKHRIVYTVLTLAMIAFLPTLIDDILNGSGRLPDKVQPTLLVWALMATLVEFLPRETASEQPTDQSIES